MKKALVALVSAFWTCSGAFAQTNQLFDEGWQFTNNGKTISVDLPHDWENPAVLGIHKLPYHATLQLPSREKECKEIISLDGQWLVHWSPDLQSCKPGLLGFIWYGSFLVS